MAQMQVTFSMAQPKDKTKATSAFVNVIVLGAVSLRFGSVFFSNKDGKVIWYTGSKEKPLGIFKIEDWKGATPKIDKLRAFIVAEGEKFLRANGVTEKDAGGTTRSDAVDLPEDK